MKPFQKIEFVHPTSYSDAVKHKSNLYSVELSGTGILSESQAVEKEI